MISALFNTPFYEGAQVAIDTPYYLPVSIGSHSYLLDLAQYERRTIPPIRPPQDNSREPGEQSLNQEGLWSRSQSSWHLGAGRAYFDEDEVRQRFWASKGLNVWDKRSLKLLNDTERKRSSTNTNLKVLQVGTRLYVADGNEVYFTDDPTPASPTFVASTMLSSGNFLSLATDGAIVWGVNTTGIRQSTAGSTTATTLIAGTYTLVAYANQRLLAANGNVLYEISRSGVATTIWTHPNPNFVWTAIIETPGAILVAGTCVDRSTIYAITLIDATTALAPPVHVSGLPDGEVLNSLEYYAGAVLLGTSRGIRIALLGSNSSLAYGPVITIPGGVGATEGQGEFVWFSWTNYDGSSSGLGRVSLADFTSELVPSYASDLMATVQGTVLSVCTIGTRRYFAVSAQGIYGETGTLVASGTLDTGRIMYGTTEKKIATSLDLRHAPLPSGASIAVSVETEEATTTPLGSSSVANTLSPSSPIGVNVAQTEAIKIKLTLNRAAALGPELSRWTLYSRVTPQLNDEIIAPLIIQDKVLSDSGEGQSIWYDPLAEYQYLQALANSKVLQVYQEGGASYTVYLTGVQLRPNDWNTDRSFFDGIIFVRMVTI